MRPPTNREIHEMNYMLGDTAYRVIEKYQGLNWGCLSEGDVMEIIGNEIMLYVIAWCAGFDPTYQ